MNFQWYPGHMTKAKRQMQEDIKLIDLVIELVDARIPLSSRNPDIDELGKNKYRLILMNKADLADTKRTKEWAEYFKGKGFYVVSLDARTKNSMKSITDIVMEACKEKIERDRKRGIKNRPVRAMVVGIPNVGQSTFINSYAGKACAKTLRTEGQGRSDPSGNCPSEHLLRFGLPAAGMVYPSSGGRQLQSVYLFQILRRWQNERFI